jgi:hypothetical protein
MRLLALVAIVLLPLAAWAADEPEPISPDRSSGSVSTSTVGRGVVQLETGLEYSHERFGGSPTQRRFSLQAAVRGGLTDRLELGVDGEPLVSLGGSDDVTKIGALQLKAKYRFFDGRPDSWLPSLGVQPFVKLPVAEEPIDSGKTDFGLLVLASFVLPGQFNLDVNAGMAGIGQSSPGGYLLQAQAALGLSRDVAESVTLFTDLSYASRADRDGRNSLGLDAGVLWRLTRNVALDASIVTSLVGQGPDWALRAGVSVRFGR